MNNTFTILASTFLVGFVAYNSLSKNTDIHFDKVDKKIEKEETIIDLLYDEQLDKLSRELVDDIIANIVLDLINESDDNSYDICSICSTCSSFIDVEVD